jgi:hypothetical protein
MSVSPGLHRRNQVASLERVNDKIDAINEKLQSPEIKAFIFDLSDKPTNPNTQVYFNGLMKDKDALQLERDILLKELEGGLQQAMLANNEGSKHH